MKTQNSLTISTVTPKEIDSILQIQKECFIETPPETREVIKSKVLFSDHASWIATYNGNAIGYALCTPWEKESIPSLNTVITALPLNQEVLYLQDLAVIPSFQGKGIAKVLAEFAVSHAKLNNFPEITLVAVQNSLHFWNKLSFKKELTVSKQITVKLPEYGSDSTFMSRKIR